MVERRRLAYCYPNVIAKVFPGGIDELLVEASVAYIAGIVNQSKAARTAELLKKQELQVARYIKAKMQRNVLIDALLMGLKMNYPTSAKADKLAPYHLVWFLGPILG